MKVGLKISCCGSWGELISDHRYGCAPTVDIAHNKKHNRPGIVQAYRRDRISKFTLGTNEH